MPYVAGIDVRVRSDVVRGMLEGAVVTRYIEHSATRMMLINAAEITKLALDAWDFSRSTHFWHTFAWSAFVVPDKKEVMRLKLAAEDFKPVVWFRAPSSAADLKAFAEHVARFEERGHAFRRYQWLVGDNDVFEMGWERERERFRRFIAERDIGWC